MSLEDQYASLAIRVDPSPKPVPVGDGWYRTVWHVRLSQSFRGFELDAPPPALQGGVVAVVAAKDPAAVDVITFSSLAHAASMIGWVSCLIQRLHRTHGVTEVEGVASHAILGISKCD